MLVNGLLHVWKTSDQDEMKKIKSEKKSDQELQ
jgi:hypothetical protein